ncbi:hypothetical protein D6783_06070 [Candidatus Woesearchaeota archaeon]|nr:MAG: hypothetical protein D6783_06070 [Candidatus Woesearchaeota archaeon]
MGFGTVATHIILFIALLTVTTSVAVLFKGYVDSSGSALKTQQQFLFDQLRTSVEITSLSFNSSADPQQTHIYVLNVGKTKLDINKTDIFIDGIRFARNDSERIIRVENDTDVVNKGIWDPDEVVFIQANRKLSSGKHTVLVVTEFGVGDSEVMST